MNFTNPDAVECLTKKSEIKFKSNILVDNYQKKIGKYPNLLLVFTMMYKNTEKTINEEKLIYDTLGMMSQLGGVLSLFLGFSFYSLICDLFDLIAKKNLICCKNYSN